MASETIDLIEGMGNQCVAVQDLARVFATVLCGTMNRETYFVCSKPWCSEESIAKEAIRITGSTSRSTLGPKFENRPKLYTVEKIKRHFGFEFDAWPEIQRTLECLVKNL